MQGALTFPLPDFLLKDSLVPLYRERERRDESRGSEGTKFEIVNGSLKKDTFLENTTSIMQLVIVGQPQDTAPASSSTKKARRCVP